MASAPTMSGPSTSTMGQPPSQHYGANPAWSTPYPQQQYSAPPMPAGGYNAYNPYMGGYPQMPQGYPGAGHSQYGAPPASGQPPYPTGHAPGYPYPQQQPYYPSAPGYPQQQWHQ